MVVFAPGQVLNMVSGGREGHIYNKIKIKFFLGREFTYFTYSLLNMSQLQESFLARYYTGSNEVNLSRTKNI